MFVLAVNCQRDESADIDADGGLPSTEVSPRQLQNRAREFAVSIDGLMDKYDYFLSKIDDKEKFFADAEDIIEQDNETYNYPKIQKILAYTSFKSVDELINQLKEMTDYTIILKNKYAKEIQNQKFLNAVYELDESEIRMDTHLRDVSCIFRFDKCFRRARHKFGVGGVICCVTTAIHYVCGVLCAVQVSYDYYLAVQTCEENYYRCKRDHG